MRDGTGERACRGKALQQFPSFAYSHAFLPSVVCVSAIVHADKVAAKLQAVLRTNPKKARPSCRKEQKRQKACKKEHAVDDKNIRVKTEKDEQPVPSVLALDKEVWEVDSDDSDLEILVVRQLKPMASLPEVPGVSLMQIKGWLWNEVIYIDGLCINWRWCSQGL